jgi:hypothetical protein
VEAGILEAATKFFNGPVGHGVEDEAEKLGPKHFVVKLSREPDMPKTEFRRKALALQKLGDEGKLVKTKVVRDRAVTKRYRQDVIDRIYRQFNSRNPEFSRRLINRVTKRMQPDHVHELQLGGGDVADNLQFLDAYTNWHIGTQQIRKQIRHLPDGTPIKIEVIKW